MRRSIFIAAGVLLAVAVIWLVTRSPGSTVLPGVVESSGPLHDGGMESFNAEPVSLADATRTTDRVLAASPAPDAIDDAKDRVVLFGRVTDESGQGLSGLRVRFEPAIGRVVDGTTAQDGTYTIAGVTPFRGAVRIAAAGFLPFRTDVEPSEVPPGTRVDAVLIATRRLHVVVKDRSRGLLTESITGDDPLFASMRVTFGRHLPDLEKEAPEDCQIEPLHVFSTWPETLPGVWWDMEAPGSNGWFACLLLGTWTMDAQPVPAQDGTLVLLADIESARPKLGWIQTVVVDDATNAPVDGASLALFGARNRQRLAQSDAAGRITVADLLPGEYRLNFAAPQHLGLVSKCVVPSAAAADLGIIRLQRGIAIVGRIEFLQGGAGQARLSCRRTDADLVLGRGPIDEKSVTTAVDGTFRFEGLHPGMYAIGYEVNDRGTWHVTDFSAPGALSSIDARNGSVAGVVMRLPKAARIR